MIPAISTAAIYSTLGSTQSLIPIFVKDTLNSIGLTTGSYITGKKLEAKDRFIDEFGTQALWLLGIPVYKWAFENTVFKAMDYDPKFDVRNFKNKKVLEQIQKFAAKDNSEFQAVIKKAIANEKILKNLTYTRFGFSTAAAIITYLGLTAFRQKDTEKCAKKEILAERAKRLQKHTYFGAENSENKTESLPEDKKPNSHPAFTGKHEAFEAFMFNPVRNLMILDGAITTSRFGKSRNRQDVIGYTVKEGSCWLFLYLLVGKIRDALEKRTFDKHNKLITLDSTVIESKEFKKILESNDLENHIKNFKEIAEKSDDVIYEYIYNNRGNSVVKVAEMSGSTSSHHNIIPLTKDNKIDTRKYIDINEVKGICKKLEKVKENFQNSGEPIDVFLNQLRKHKRASIIANLAICVAAIGVIAPAIMVALRFADKNNKNFQVKEDLAKELDLVAA